MKLVLLYLMLSCAIARAAELAPLISNIEPCKRVVVIGQVRTSPPGTLPLIYRKVDFQTTDASKIDLLLKWLKAIPTEDTEIRFKGVVATVSTKNVLLFKLEGKDDKERPLRIYAGRDIIFNDNEKFKINGECDIDGLFAIIVPKKGATVSGKNQATSGP